MPSSIWSDRLTSTVPTAGKWHKWLRFDGQAFPSSQKKLALHYERLLREAAASLFFCFFAEVFLTFTHQIEAYWKNFFGGLKSPRVLNFLLGHTHSYFLVFFFLFCKLFLWVSKFKRCSLMLSKQVLQVVKMDSSLFGLCIIPIVPSL